MRLLVAALALASAARGLNAPPQADYAPALEARTIRQPLDHFSARRDGFFDQRYFVAAHQRPEIIFFYAGNEAPVEKYVASCGLMWEHRLAFRATLVFAEHRFWGGSIPEDLRYEFMGPEQALEDYFALIRDLRANGSLPVVAFGGSYGGMLAAWARLLRPDLIAAAVASSAPVLAFFDPRVDAAQQGRFYGDGGASYWRVVSRGHFAPCADGIYDALAQGLDAPGAFAQLGACDASRNADELAAYVAYVLETMAMGDYPFASDYIDDGGGLPPWPVAAACRAFQRHGMGVRGLRAAVGLFMNATGKVPCWRVPARMDAFYDGLWDRMWCGSLMPQETYFATRGAPWDMFRAAPLDWRAVEAHCLATWGVFARKDAIFKLFGAVTAEDWAARATRIVFVNGLLDPWSAGGFARAPSEQLPVVLLEHGAHHADLFFSHVADPPEFAVKRKVIMAHVRRFLRRGGPGEVYVY